MSVASISYGSLKDASNEAKSVARKLDKYSDAVYDSVYKKLNNYRGSWSSNLTTAKSKANDKISALKADADRYERYAEDLIDLKDACEATDKSVKSKVSSLTATFKETHGISNNPVVNFINYILTSVRNSSVFGRWLGDGLDRFDSARNYIKEKIKTWYNYEGGKELVKGIVVGILEVAIGFISVALAVLSGGALLVIIAGVVAGVIAIVNAGVNLVNEFRAYNATQNDDPATGMRRSSENTLQDTLRTETDSRFWHGFAMGVDVVNAVCAVVTLASSGSKLLKNGYKWATGSVDDLKNIKIKNILTWDNGKAFFGKLRTSTGQGWTELSSALKMREWSFFKTVIKDFGTDFANNFKGEFMDFGSIKDSLSSTKNILSIFKDLAKDGLNFNNILKTGWDNIALPCITVVDLPIAPGGGYKAITIDNFTSIYDKISSKVINSPIFKNGGPISADVLSTLSRSSDINISIPDLHIPGGRFDIPALNAA